MHSMKKDCRMATSLAKSFVAWLVVNGSTMRGFKDLFTASQTNIIAYLTTNYLVTTLMKAT